MPVPSAFLPSESRFRGTPPSKKITFGKPPPFVGAVTKSNVFNNERQEDFNRFLEKEVANQLTDEVEKIKQSKTEKELLSNVQEAANKLLEKGKECDSEECVKKINDAIWDLETITNIEYEVNS